MSTKCRPCSTAWAWAIELGYPRQGLGAQQQCCWTPGRSDCNPLGYSRVWLAYLASNIFHDCLAPLVTCRSFTTTGMTKNWGPASFDQVGDEAITMVATSQQCPGLYVKNSALGLGERHVLLPGRIHLARGKHARQSRGHTRIAPAIVFLPLEQCRRQLQARHACTLPRMYRCICLGTGLGCPCVPSGRMHIRLLTLLMCVDIAKRLCSAPDPCRVHPVPTGTHTCRHIEMG